MKERVIPYSADMVRARRAGLKTQTRRVVKDQHIDAAPPACFFQWLRENCPYGQPGDHLLTREAWRTLTEYNALPPREVPVSAPIWYEADGPAPAEFGRYRHARFMCRWMSRGIDEVVDVRVERLQDISEDDAEAEGCDRLHDDEPGYIHRVEPDWNVCPHCGGTRLYTAFSSRGTLPDTDCTHCDTYAKRYRWLWESINGAGSWDTNPYVWVVEFKRVMP